MSLVNYDNNILRQCLEDFRFQDDDPQKIEEDLCELMDKYNGVGLAANQVGINSRVFAIKIGNKSCCVFNPIILSYSAENIVYTEGCLSFPNLYLKISRAKSIDVEWYDSKNNKIQETLVELPARIFLHEYDHLNGVTFGSLVSPIIAKMAIDKANKKSSQKYFYKKII